MEFKNQDEAVKYFWEKVARHNEDFGYLERWIDEQEITNDETLSEEDYEDIEEERLQTQDYQKSQGYPYFNN